MPLLLDLYVTFFRIGLFTFGGGYAMLPLLQREVVEKKGWATEEDLLDYYAVGQCTPGIIAVNTGTFVGCQQKGLWGGLLASLGVVSPSVIIITVIAALLSNFSHLPVVINAFAGIRICVCVLILNAVVKLWKKAVVDKVSLVIFLAVFLLSVFTGLNPVWFVLVSGFAGILIQVWGKGQA